MSTELRFPSGITVTQARKDAKKLARAESIKLHEAQNRVAHSNGLNLSWAKALAWLEQQPRPLMTFRLPLDPERNNGATHHLIDLYPEAPVILIAGRSGAGKTVLALELARQALLNTSAPAHYCTTEGFQSATSHPWDIGVRQHAHLKHLAPTLFHTHEFPRDAVPLEMLSTKVVKGSMVVIDEFGSSSRKRTELIELMTWARENRCVLVLIEQMFENMALLTHKSQDSELSSYMGAAALGSDYQHLLDTTAALECSPGQCTDFLVFDFTRAWHGIVRHPLPDWNLDWTDGPEIITH